jgi:hypothetical protein
VCVTSQVSKDKRRTETNNNRPATSADLSKDGDSAFVELSSLEDTDINDQLVWNRQVSVCYEKYENGVMRYSNNHSACLFSFLSQ